MGRIYYLDHAAATPCDERVVQAMQPYLSELFYNPSSSYGGGQKAHDALEGARADIAGLIGAKPDDIVFTAGATESINLAIYGALAGGGGAIISAVEHVAVRAAVEQFPYDIAAVDPYGMTRVEDIERLVNDETRLVSVVLADNEFGTVQPIAEIARLVESIRSDRQQRGVTEPIYLFCDASQGQTALDINVARLGADMLTLNAGKCYGPKQVGLLWLRSSVQIEPLIRGGGQERNLRNGTENVAGAVGFACALELAQKGRYSESERLREIKYALRNQLEATVEGVEFDGHPKKSLPGHLHFHVDGLDAERVVFHLDMHGVYIATGAACTANKATRIPALEAIGLTSSQADGSLRITLGHLNKLEDVPVIAKEIADAIAAERML